MVGGALKEYFESVKKITPFIYDKGKNLGSIKEVDQADIIFICVPTPFTEKEGFDLSYVKEACRYISGEKIVIIKSTVLPGTTQKLQAEFPVHKFLFNPEFLTEATAQENMDYPERQIIGYTEKSRDLAEMVLGILPKAEFQKAMPSGEAEMAKYFSNTFFSLKVTFANQMYDLCQKLKLDYESVKEAASHDKMVGGNHLDIFHKNYRGYGGKCLTKDIRALIQLADENGMDLELHKIAEKINNKLMKEQGIDNPEEASKK